MRPVTVAFDPAGIENAPSTKHGSFSFLEDAKFSSVPGFENCRVIDPHSVGVPWPTSFPGAPQCKYWREAEEAATTMLNQVYIAPPNEKGSLPKGLADGKLRAAKQKEILDTSVSAPMHMFASANPARAKIMAKANLLIFMHDDLIDSESSRDFETTIIDDALVEGGTLEHDYANISWKSKIFFDFVQETLQEDNKVGPLLVRGILTWVKQTRDNLPDSMKFSTLDDYIDYRIKDFAVDFCDAAIMLTCEIHLSLVELEPLARLHRLYMTHFSLTNDLYSYGKEVYAMQESGIQVVNAVYFLKSRLAVSSRASKVLLRAFLWDLEAQIDEEFHRLSSMDLSPSQQRFARGMIQTLAGNIFYSATAIRYAAIGYQ